MYNRLRQLDQLENSISDSAIKVIYGVRRAGKTTLFEQFRSFLKRQGVPSERIIDRDFDHVNDPHLLTPEAIVQGIKKELTEGRENYLLLDELERVPDYQQLVRQLYKISNVDLYVSSSANGILSLTDQFPCDLVYLGPLSFREFVDYHRLTANMSSLYHYLNTGGFPFAQDIRSRASAWNYFEDVINTVIINGFAQKNSLCNPKLAQQLAIYLARRPGKLTNVSKAVSALQEKNVKVSNKTLSAYLRFLQEGFLFLPCRELDLSSGNIKATNVQYFPVDPSLRWFLTNRHGALSETSLTCVVFNELVARGFQVFTGANNQHPITFVAVRDGRRHFVQFNYSLLNPTEYQRATAGLRRMPADCPRTLIVAKPDENTWSADEEFCTVDLLDWLMAE